VGGVDSPPTQGASAPVYVSLCTNTKDFRLLHLPHSAAASGFDFGRPSWLPDGPSDGPEQIPSLESNPSPPPIPSHLVGFDRLGRDAEPQESMLHFYVTDRRIQSLARSPHRQLYGISRYSSVTTPDFSLYRSMPRHMRIGSVWNSRAVGVYFQSRGLRVVPSLRWSGQHDYDFCFAGVPHGAPVTVSNHGCWRDRSDKLVFEDGVRALVERLSPPYILLHGRPVSTGLQRDLARNSVEIHLYPPRIAVVGRGGSDGRR